MKYIILLAIIGISLQLISAQPPVHDDVKSGYFDQKLDHFLSDSETQIEWKQKYQYIDKLFDQNTGPVFLIVGGEGELSIGYNSYRWIHELAEKYKGIIIGLEHRFYGESQPFGKNEETFSVQNLQYLSSTQALTDLSSFITNHLLQNSFKGIQKGRNPIFTVGYSYPGALSVWARSQLPNLVDGAISGSSVINSIYDFYEYDEQVYRSLSKSGDCADKSADIIRLVEKQLLNGDTQTKDSFEAQSLSDLDFLNFLGEVISSNVQNGMRTEFCSRYIEGKSAQQTLSILSQKFQYIDFFYGQYYNQINEPQYANSMQSGRQWFWQQCSEFGWFQTGRSILNGQGIKSSLNDAKYFENKCKYAFGEDFQISSAISERTNQKYGGLNLSGDNIIISNGIEDPWKLASYIPELSSNHSIISDVSDCTDCAHGAIMNNNDSVVEADRETLEKVISEWIHKIQSGKRINNNPFLSQFFNFNRVHMFKSQH